jgi:putative ABC transport system permease protein
MKTLIKISWRNIWRNRTRSLIIIVAIIVGLMGGIFSAAIRLGAENQRFRESVENQISHIQIHHPQFIPNPEARYRIPDGFKLTDELMQHPEIKIASPRTVFDGMAATANLNTGVRIKGIDPEIEAQTTYLDKLIVEGTYFPEKGRLPSVIVGKALAGDLRSDVGSRIVLTFQDVDGEIVSASFRIEGLYSVTSKRFEERIVFVSASDINGLVDDEEAVTEIAIVLNDPDTYRFVANELKDRYPGLEIRHWANIDPSLFYALEFLERNLVFLVGIIILGVSFGLLNTILMSVLERVREFGVLMAVGMKKIKVFGMVVLETSMVSVIGGVLGLISSYGLVEYLHRRGVNLAGYGGEGLEAYGFAAIVYPEVEPVFYFKIALLVVAFSIAAALYPAWKAIRLVPAEAVRQE